MRKFRNAALAVATATTVAISGVSVASAAPTGGETVTLSGNDTLSKIRKAIDPDNKLEWDKPAAGKDVFGATSWKNNEAAKARTPMWAKIADSLLITTAAISAFGLVVAPIYNFLRYGINR
ncbi:hypothetical protein QQA05_09645 [Corynebacterium macclintockiae]|uniref:hypothetical protein n=1 Tax=Corynebacterium macclintockiae TaxID=2913501 RepID=UPI00254DDBEC|nr:hypothetical protein [Corynebacterium macclintockiae]MDK8891654.1 hypothetical protein [Corynebacterium macclintockiae]